MQQKKKKKRIWKDFLSQTGTTKFQKTRSSCEAAHAVFGPNCTRLGAAQNNKAAFHGNWGFSGQILKVAGADLRTRIQRGYRKRSRWHLLSGCSSPYDTFALLSFRELGTRIKDDLRSMETGSTMAAMGKRVAIFTFQTRLSHLLRTAF